MKVWEKLNWNLHLCQILDYLLFQCSQIALGFVQIKLEFYTTYNGLDP